MATSFTSRPALYAKIKKKKIYAVVSPVLPQCSIKPLLKPFRRKANHAVQKEKSSVFF